MSKSFLGLVSALLILGVSGAARAEFDRTPDRCPWVFFDLGKGSIVETPEPFGQSIHFAAGDAQNGGAFEYLTALHDLGFTLGLIVNFPDDYPGAVWPAPEYHEARRAAKRAFIMNLIQTGWTDEKHPMSNPGEWEAFWNLFADRFLITATDDEYKTKSDQLFGEAMQMAQSQGCDAVYESALIDEQTRLAKFAATHANGIVPFFEGHDDGANFYLDPARLPTYTNE